MSLLLCRAFSTLGLAVAVALGAPIVSGCMGRTVTPADLERNGTKVYAGHDRNEVVKASALALRTLGYDVVLEDVSSGRVKTAPKTVQVLAVGNSSVARGYLNSLAWSLEISDSGRSTVVRAVPRASTNGQPVDMSAVSADYMDRVFTSLWGEIDSNLDQSAPGSVSATEKPSSTGSPAPSTPKKKSVPTAI